jgi:hypothetical protein
MVDNTLDFLRQDLLAKRINGMPGGNRYEWGARCAMLHHERIFDADKDEILRASSAVERKFIAPDLAALRKQLMTSGVVLTKATSTSRKRAFAISDDDEDLAQDTMRQAGMSFGIYKTNSTVLAFHDSSRPPVATSNVPVTSGKTTIAIASFPDAGVSAESDQMLAAIDAGLMRGASVGVIPKKWKYSTNPARPFGVDIIESILLEWSLTPQPCNPRALFLGAVENKSAAIETETKLDARQQRLAEARKLSLAAYRA